MVYNILCLNISSNYIRQVYQIKDRYVMISIVKSHD